MRSKCVLCAIVALSFLYPASAQTKRKVIIDQDARGPATTDQQSILVFLQSPEVEVLGITVVSGDMWRDEEMAHTLRMLELVGRTDVPVVPGAVYPIINRMELIERWEGLYGKVRYQGAWNKRPTGDGQRGVFHGPYEVPDLKEGNPTTKPIEEDAAHFIIRMLHKYPHEVTVYAGGPLTDIAQAISLDPAVPDLAQELVIMGGSIAPATPYPWATTNRREFNFWWDPESVHMTLTAPGWHKITITTVDISIKTRMDKAMIAEIGNLKIPWRNTSRNMPTKNIAGTNLPPLLGSIPASSPSKRNFIWTWTTRTGPAMAIRSSGCRAPNRGLAKISSTCRRNWIWLSSTKCLSI